MSGNRRACSRASGWMFLAVAWASPLASTAPRAVSICLKTGMEAAYREIVMAVPDGVSRIDEHRQYANAACLLPHPAPTLIAFSTPGESAMSTEQDFDNTAEPANALQLNSTEVRILGCLIEKQATNPETYPLTLNALVLACNQKTSREPVMTLTPGQVGQSLRALEGQQLTRLVMGSRADRWEHRVDKTLELVPAQLILTGLLLL